MKYIAVSLVFNDLCVRHDAPNKETARQWMQQFGTMLTHAVDRGLNTLRTHAGFEEIMLSPDYPMQAWFNDHEADQVMREFILYYAQRYPLIKPYADDLDENEPVMQRIKGIIGIFDDEEALGLVYAHLLGGLSVSLPSEECWQSAYLQLQCWENDLERPGETIEIEVQLKHAAETLHLDEHQEWLEERIKNSVLNGKDLLKKAKLWFPHLIFCKNAEKQIRAIRSGSRQLHRVVERLFDLEAAAMHWGDGSFEISTISNASEESVPTLNQYGKDREFVCPDGKTRLFNAHLKAIPDAWRIHIFPDEDVLWERATDGKRKILVGYVGPHLSTVNDPT